VSEPLASPAFGQADLTNCERELIHLAGSVQPHGVLLVLRESDLAVMQASENVAALLGLPVAQLLNRPIQLLGGDVEAQVRRLVAMLDSADPKPLRCTVETSGVRREFEGLGHRHPGGGIIVELEPLATVGGIQTVDADDRLRERLAAAVEQFSGAMNLAALSESVVKHFREMLGHDRVMVYRFDPNGHGEIIAEARDPRLEPLLGHRYPASDIPQRARELYVRNRVRVLVDVNYTPVPITPRRAHGGEELDMSMCYLRSMSPLHIQYLQNMGVTATLVVSLVREGRLWGLIACHHYAPRHVRYAVRVACDLLAEVISTRIAAIENYVQTQVEVLVRRLELRLIEATSTEGDWRPALFRNPRTLLQPLDATGAALFHDGEILTAGEVPSTPELRTLATWVAGEMRDSLFSCSSVAQANEALASLTPTASGVLAVELAAGRPDFLMWFRKEQLRTVTWAGDPSKPVLDNDPLKLSPRRSFAAWSELVRGTAAPWSTAEHALAAAIGASLRDIILQIQAVRLLIAQHQLVQFRATVEGSREPVVIADAAGRILFCNESFSGLFRRPHVHLERLDDVASLFVQPASVRSILHSLASERRPWRGELSLAVSARDVLPVGVRADVVQGQQGTVLGFIVILTDLSASKKAEAARRHLEQALSQTGLADAAREPGSMHLREPDQVIGAILANANVAAMEVADAAGVASVASLLEDLEASTQRAAALYREIRDYVGRK
jgi:light-regulated signal transduction histidine kinase (bacteriophytochrome)